MTNKEIARITRSWVGHITTNPSVRDQMAGDKTNDDWADLINDTVIPKDNVTPDDVPKIRDAMAQMFRDGGPVSAEVAAIIRGFAGQFGGGHGG
ncbi:MAG TPA: hypothetical protein VGP41_05040 [Candidatus Lustribacter sp.]|jgi:hypothetical protein|nr:hypothetical protein [Candidatus Lustribacter sp.]